jgi:uncharacterized protein
MMIVLKNNACSAAVALLAPIPMMLMGCGMMYRAIGGNFEVTPTALEKAISAEAMELVERAFDGVDPADGHALADFHIHHVSHEMHPSWTSWRHPYRRIRTKVFMRAAGVSMGESASDDYVTRVVELAKDFPKGTRLYLYALDWSHELDGAPVPERTPLYVSNESVYEVVQQYPDLFVPVISIHPYRDDAVERLRYWSERGCRHVKWLPNSMGIDPAEERVQPFYAAMRELDMVLLSHTGCEHALEAADQSLGNPLLLRAALDAGVTTVALHAASDGTCEDIDCPDRSLVPCFDLFMRMMDEPAYDGLLFGEISAVTFFNHLSRPLRVLLERDDMHHRLVNGSDYPVCAVNIVIQTSALVRQGFLTSEERRLLNEVYRANPLLFDFLVKRTVRHQESGARFSNEVFVAPAELQ